MLSVAEVGRTFPGVEHSGLGKTFSTGKSSEAEDDRRGRPRGIGRTFSKGVVGQRQALPGGILFHQSVARSAFLILASKQGGSRPNPWQLSGAVGSDQGFAKGHFRPFRRGHVSRTTRLRGFGQDGGSAKPRKLFFP